MPTSTRCRPAQLFVHPVPASPRAPRRFALALATLVLGVLALLPAPFLLAQAATGTVEGRVQDRVTGDYLNHARVAVKGTPLTTLTDSSGMFRLSGVPAGAITLDVFFTGLDRQEVAVNVAPGQTAQKDVQLSSRARSGDTDAVQLDKFLVESTRETNAAAIAVNEQRFALSQKSVISADQFGTIPDSNPGELLKWLPGVSVQYFANNIVGVSVRGLNADNTEISFDGMPVASASTATASTPGRGRNFEMMGASSSDISRVEVRKLRTPEDSANALGGSINLVRRSAFEADRRRLTYNLLFTTDAEEFSLRKRAGIRDTKIYGWRPNFKLTWTDPISKTFGYTLTLNHNDVLARVHWSSPSKNFGTAAHATDAAARRAAGLPLTTVSVFNPLLRQDLLHDNPKQDVSDAASIKFDWKPLPALKLSYSLSGSRYQEKVGDELRFLWNVGAQTNLNPNTPLGRPGTNDQSGAYGELGAGSIRYNMFEAWRNGIKTVVTNALESEWRKGAWIVSARGSYSTSRHIFRDTDDGFFGSTNMNGSTLPDTGIGIGFANPRPITVNLLNPTYKISQDIRAYGVVPGSTTVGPEVNWQDLNNMYVGGAVSRPATTLESIAAVRLWAKHSFHTGNPFAIRLGFDFTEQFRNLQRYDANMWTFVGPDGQASTPDDNAAQIAAVNVKPERDTRYNSPAVPRISLTRLYQIYLAHPNWFQNREAESHRFSVVDPYELDEKTYASYLELTGAFFHHRLTYVGGMRYERAVAWGLGNRDNGAASTVGISDPLLAAQKRYVRKGARGSGSNDGYFPSLQINYNLAENLILRAGYAKTQAKNRFQRSVIPSSTFNSIAPISGPFEGIAVGTVNRPNPSLRPWVADNLETHLEYYTRQGGVISAGAFRKNIDRMQVQQIILLDTPQKLAQLDLDPTFLNFQSNTWINQGIGRLDGFEFEIRQTLDSLVPQFARGFAFTGSFNYNNLSKFNYANGNIGSDFGNFYENQYKGSLAYRRGRLSATVGVIRNGRVYLSRGDQGGYVGHNINAAYTTVDFSVEYSVTRWAKLFVSGRNVTDARRTGLRLSADSPQWSSYRGENNLGVTYTAGVTGSF